MKLQQFRTIVEVSRQGLNLSKAAQTLFTSQPALSKQILQLEEELGVTIFVRAGKRFVGITPPGQEVLAIAERILLEARSLKDVSAEFHRETAGAFTIATTHTQARYVLPPVVRRFMKRYPQVRLSLRQGSPTQIAEQVVHGHADMAIATEALDQFPQLAMLPCYEWNRCIVVPPDHPLLALRKVGLEDLASHPIITYDFAFTGRSAMQRAFESRGLKADVVLTALDADVIKTYVELALGVGIIAQMAFDPKRDRQLRAIDASHLFPPSLTHIGIRRGTYLRGFAYDFITMFAPHLTRETVDTALAAAPAARDEPAPRE